MSSSAFSCPEHEDLVIGSLLFWPESIEITRDFLVAGHFENPAYRLAYQAILDMTNEGVSHIDAFSVGDRIWRTAKPKDKEAIGSTQGEIIAFLQRLTGNEQLSPAVLERGRVVYDHAYRRYLRSISAQMSKVAATPSTAADAEVEALKVFESMKGTSFSKVKVSSLFDGEGLSLMETRTTEPGLSTGFKRLDKMGHGLEKKDMVIIAGRPSNGKTSLALQMMLSLTDQAGVMFLSLEQSKEQLWNRALSILTGIEHNRIKFNSLSAEERVRVAEVEQAFQKKRRLLIATDRGMTASALRVEVRKAISKHGVAVVFIDHIQAMKSDRRNDSRHREISETISEIRTFAGDFDVTAVILSQLNRKENDTGRPTMGSLRESGALESDADVIWFVHRLLNTTTNAELGLEKHRGGGECGWIPAYYDVKTMRFMVK